METKFCKLLCFCLAGAAFVCALKMPAAAHEHDDIVTYDPGLKKFGTESVNILSHEEQFKGYVRSEFFEDANTVSRSTGEDNLSGREATLYRLIKKKIKNVAGGFSDSSELKITPQRLGFKSTITPSDCNNGITSFTPENTVDSLYSYVDIDFEKIFNYIIADMPYEMYWCDKVAGWEYGFGTIDSSSNTIRIPNLIIKMYVDCGYSKSGVKDELTTDVNTDKTVAARKAAQKAKAIVEEVKSTDASDYERLKAYKDIICDLVDYNTDAMQNDYNGDMNPWQLIYVFDEDSDTNVVCEGYSKAFQYLCELDGHLECYSVAGYMEGGMGEGLHMWNIVRLDDKSYLCDITNCDKGSIGENGSLFMAGQGKKLKFWESSDYFDLYGDFHRTDDENYAWYSLSLSEKEMYDEELFELAKHAYTE